MSAPKLGSGARFKKLSSTLAARGASNPDALAAWIGRRKYGAKKFGKLSAHGHSNITGQALNFAMMQCPSCGYQADDADFSVSGGASGTSSGPSSVIQAPGFGSTATDAGMNAGQIGMPGTGTGRFGSQSARGSGLANAGQRDLRSASPAVANPWDIMISRAEDGSAVIRHRRGGEEIGRVRHLDDGTWKAERGGRQLSPHSHQRAALMDLIAVHNHGTTTPEHRAAGSPLQPAAVQTPLMERYGVPAIRLATPAVGGSDGPRATTSGDSGSSMEGLTPKGVTIYKKLIGRGFPAARALSFARRAQSFGNS